MESALWQHYAPEAYMAVRKVHGYVKTNVSTDAALVERGLILAGNEITKVNQSRLTEKGAAWIAERLESDRVEALGEHMTREGAVSIPRGLDALRLACLSGIMRGFSFLADDEIAAYGATERVICDTHACGKDATHAVRLRFDDLWDYSNQCADDTARIRRDPSFHSAVRLLDGGERSRPVPDLLTARDPRNDVMIDIDRLGRLMRHRDCGHSVINSTVMDLCEAQTFGQIQAARPVDDGLAASGVIRTPAFRDGLLDTVDNSGTRALAKTLHGRVASGWNARDCDHVPPITGCWCALLSAPLADISQFEQVPFSMAPPLVDVEPMCAAMDYPCAGVVVTTLACCSTPVCSAHAADTIDGPCPACGSTMTTVLAVYDSRVPRIPSSRPVPEDVRPASPVRYGVTVEWWDDAQGIARTAVIGSHETWEVAVMEMARIKRMDRFDRVTGTIPLYASLEDF
jgi:hypothetical protein